MNKLYCLNFYTNPNGNYREGFHIGLFWTYDKAKEIELFYRKEVSGFKDYKCDAEITEVPVLGDMTQITCVYRYLGWNINEDLDEVDIVESDCYVDYAEAEKDFYETQATLKRKEWGINRHIIGQCNWQEGFVRIWG